MDPVSPQPDEAYRRALGRIFDAARSSSNFLDLSGRGLRALPPEIQQCAALSTLLLNGNHLVSLPPEIGRCTALTILNISHNELRTLPPEIGQCTKLVELDADGNQLTALPPEIGGCTALSYFHLRRNQLGALPVEIQQCTKLKWLYLHWNAALGLPPEVLGPDLGEGEQSDPKAILDYYFSRRTQATNPLNEVKIVFVGRGGTGKTSLVDRLVRNSFTEGQKETVGVQLSDWIMKGCAGGPVTAHLWDFAGQTITHAMHQFFLSVRTVYVLLLTGRESSEKDDAEYWLKLIAAYGTDDGAAGPPVIVALNKWDDPGAAHARIDRRALKEKHPFIVDFVETDCKTETGLPKLRQILDEQVNALPWVRQAFPGSYSQVKERLVASREPYLPYDAFRRICAECGVQEEDRQDALAANLHALGIALNFRHDPRLRFASVLKPAWLTTHVYAIVRHAAKHAGVLRRTKLPTVLAGEPDLTMRQFLVDMMVRFELAYPVAEDGAEPDLWLIPQALPDSQPEGVETFSTEPGATRLRYTYRALPVSIVPRFTVRTHPFIEGELRWASGTVLTLNGARALIRADYAEKQVNVVVTGPKEGRRELAGLALRELRFINGQIKGLNPAEEMQVAGEWVPVKTLEHDEAARRATGVATGTGTIQVDPAKELNGLSTPSARDESWKPRVFISYAHADEPQRRKLELYLGVLATHGIVFETWHDRKIQAGEKWDAQIRGELAAADVVLLLVSTAALASRYIQSVEIKLALANQKQVIIPILLEDCEWKLPELKALQALPAGWKPIRDWKPHAKGWKSVSDGLKKVFTTLHSRGPLRKSGP